MLRVSVGVTGDGSAAFDRILGVAADVVGDMKPIFDRVVRPYVLRHLDQQFNTLGSHGGKPWESLDGEPKYRDIILDKLVTGGTVNHGLRFWPSLESWIGLCDGNRL